MPVIRDLDYSHSTPVIHHPGMAGAASLKLPLSLSKLALKTALPVTVFAVASVVLVQVLAIPVPLWGALAWAVLLGIFTYILMYRLLVKRLAFASTTLRQIRQHQFENLNAVQTPRGDELDTLLWQVYRTGLVVESEMNELKRIENYRREFLGNVSHELKTPIFTIQGFTETLLDGALEDDNVNRSFLEKILRNTSRLSSLTRDLTEISRMEIGEFRMNVQPFGLRHVVREVAESLELAAQAKNITLRMAVPDDLPPVTGDRDRIRQVLINLTENAIKYNNAGGYVELAAKLLDPGEVLIAVSDNGIGVMPQDIPRLTERFYRVDKSRSREQGGTGLGLSIVKHILVAHHTSLRIESKFGQGSTFSFTLPVFKTGASTSGHRL
jgi:two-component system, OmpR family, phosphate regulon sensor histidine kinase PhoR